MHSPRQPLEIRRDADQKALALATVIFWTLIIVLAGAYIA